MSHGERHALDQIADELRPALHDYLRGDRGVEADVGEIKSTGRKRLERDTSI